MNPTNNIYIHMREVTFFKARLSIMQWDWNAGWRGDNSKVVGGSKENIEDPMWRSNCSLFSCSTRVISLCLPCLFFLFHIKVIEPGPENPRTVQIHGRFKVRNRSMRKKHGTVRTAVRPSGSVNRDRFGRFWLFQP